MAQCYFFNRRAGPSSGAVDVGGPCAAGDRVAAAYAAGGVIAETAGVYAGPDGYSGMATGATTGSGAGAGAAGGGSTSTSMSASGTGMSLGAGAAGAGAGAAAIGCGEAGGGSGAGAGGKRP